MTSGDQRADEEAIRALLDQQVKGWAAGDPAAYASVFTADPQYITFLGSRYRGRDAIAASRWFISHMRPSREARSPSRWPRRCSRA
nr:SgcJ/EcaC family oxidoreductase [Mycobacterium sp. 1165178.9]